MDLQTFLTDEGGAVCKNKFCQTPGNDLIACTGMGKSQEKGPTITNNEMTKRTNCELTAPRPQVLKVLIENRADVTSEKDMSMSEPTHPLIAATISSNQEAVQ
eukprot:6475945-Amphidinium_carterae.1